MPAMPKLILLVAVSTLLAALFTGACFTPEQPGVPIDASSELPKVKLTSAFPALKFDRPLWFGHDGSDKEIVYVVEQGGRIYRFENKPEVAQARLFLDLSEKVLCFRNGGHNEEGLLGLAFHPNFKDNGYFFVHYSAGTARKRRGVTARFTLSKADKTIADPASEKVIFEVDQPYGNHKGCSLLFGADGFLYASLGDGGSQQDPHNNGQNLGTFLSKVLRIDVDKEATGKSYAIPQDNPFITRKGALPEIWAYGLRNPWRMSFDSKTGDLWAGDVGQNSWEWVVLIKKGGNYGWALREGSHKFKDGEPVDAISDPIIEYGHKEGVSITGGYVYRGEQQPKLQGIYFYADYGSGRLWGLKYANGKVTHAAELLDQRKMGISSFGTDSANELFACCFDGKIYRIEAIE